MCTKLRFVIAMDELSLPDIYQRFSRFSIFYLVAGALELVTLNASSGGLTKASVALISATLKILICVDLQVLARGGLQSGSIKKISTIWYVLRLSDVNVKD